MNVVMPVLADVACHCGRGFTSKLDAKAVGEGGVSVLSVFVVREKGVREIGQFR